MIKGLNFVFLWEYYLIYLWLNTTITAYWKHLWSFLMMEGIAALLFFYPIRRIYIYDPPRLKFILWYLWYNKWKESNVKSLPFIEVSNSIWYLEISNWKNSSVTSSALLLIMISMLPLFGCITCSSSLSMEEIKLFSVANWILNVSDFLRSFIISFKYGLTWFLVSLIVVSSIFFSVKRFPV